MTNAPSPISFHYFRLSRHLWELMLTRMRQLGAETIFTPIPWLIHEFEAGQVDLHGVTDPRRDVIAFVELCQQMGFALWLDLSPESSPDLQLLNNGVPPWLAQQHPDVKAKDADGNPLPFYTTIHPLFQKFSARWLTHLSEALSPKIAPAGPITQVQINLTQPTDVFDYNDQIAKVHWPVWLRKRYVEGGIEAINAAYQPSIPFRTVNNVDLNASLSATAFAEDKQAFRAALHTETTETYQGFLSNDGWPMVAAIAPPPHGFQVESDPIDVGITFEWAMDAPIQADGSLRHTFWRQKAESLKQRQDHLPAGVGVIAANQAPITLLENAGQLYRLLTDGLLLDQPKSKAPTFSPIIADEGGETDFYFTLAEANHPLPPFLNDYLQSLLAGQLAALNRCSQSATQLGQALQPASPPSTGGTPPPLTEAHRSLQEASVALRRAAASIGALEDAFSTALDKPQLLADTPLLLAVDSRQLEPIHGACQAVVSTLSTALSMTIANPITVAQYQVAHQQAISAAERSVALLDEQLRWLRQQLITGNLSSSARTVHYYVELLLQSLGRGVLRR